MPSFFTQDLRAILRSCTYMASTLTSQPNSHCILFIFVFQFQLLVQKGNLKFFLSCVQSNESMKSIFNALKFLVPSTFIFFYDFGPFVDIVLQCCLLLFHSSNICDNFNKSGMSALMIAVFSKVVFQMLLIFTNKRERFRV